MIKTKCIYRAYISYKVLIDNIMLMYIYASTFTILSRKTLIMSSYYYAVHFQL